MASSIIRRAWFGWDAPHPGIDLGPPHSGPAEIHLFVDDYSNGFVRIVASSVTAQGHRADVALATVPGPNGEVYASIDDILDGAAVWADFNGSLGKVKDRDGGDFLGAALKQAITDGSVATVHREGNDIIIGDIGPAVMVTPPPAAGGTDIPTPPAP